MFTLENTLRNIAIQVNHFQNGREIAEWFDPKNAICYNMNNYLAFLEVSGISRIVLFRELYNYFNRNYCSDIFPFNKGWNGDFQDDVKNNKVWQNPERLNFIYRYLD